MNSPADKLHLLPRQVLNETLVSQLHGLRLKLDIFSQDLNRDIFGKDDFVDTLRKWVIQCPRAQVRIFVHRAQRSMMRGNTLIELGLNLTSYFQFREPSPQQLIELDDMLLIDGRSAVTWSARQPEIRLIDNHPLQVIPMQVAFDECWQLGQASQQIRNLYL